MIVITGAAGFIGSCLAAYLNEPGYDDLCLVDDFSREDKRPNHENKGFRLKIDRSIFPAWFEENAQAISFVFHLGARTDTSETDGSVFEAFNLSYSQQLWKICAAQNIPFVYASSAATYGAGENGYKDDHDVVWQLSPLNAYGRSKNEFDKWALQQEVAPPHWAGLKFFNVYGPNEYHKGRMASVAYHAFNQVKDTGEVKLFRSHRADFEDGKQLRDFIYVKDVVDVCRFFMDQQPGNGLYNVGAGRADTFLNLVNPIFTEMGKTSNIKFIDIPEDIRDNYQYYTQADMSKLRQAGYDKAFSPVGEGVADYVSSYLKPGRYW